MAAEEMMRYLVCGAGLLLAIATLPGCLNFDVVQPGRVYRSSQPDREELRTLREDRGVLSVLNLRGRQPEEAWWLEEEAACRDLGMTLFNVAWPSTAWPARDAVLAVLDVFDTAPYPLLIHCRAGADRTGLASALYLIARRHLPVDEAAEQLTAAHGHFGWLTGTGEMSAFLELFRSTAHGKELRRWVRDDYEREREGLLGGESQP